MTHEAAVLPPDEEETEVMEDVMVRMLNRLALLVKRTSYRPDYEVIIGTTRGMKYPYLQVAHFRPDANTGVDGWGHGGKAYISEYATDSEIFQTIFGLLKAYEEHEVREFFKVDGKCVFGPHISTTALASVADQLDVR